MEELFQVLFSFSTNRKKKLDQENPAITVVDSW